MLRLTTWKVWNCVSNRKGHCYDHREWHFLPCQSCPRPLTLFSLNQQLSSARSGHHVRPERAEESCWLYANGRCDMLAFIANIFSWGIQIWNRYIDIVAFVWFRIYAGSNCKVLKLWQQRKTAPPASWVQQDNTMQKLPNLIEKQTYMYIDISYIRASWNLCSFCSLSAGKALRIRLF